MTDNTRYNIDGNFIGSDGHDRKASRVNASTLRIVDKIRMTTDFHDHNMLVYPDLPTFRTIYTHCAKQALDNDEIVFLATTYDSFDKVTGLLANAGIAVDNETKAGNLAILDSFKAYQIDVGGAIKFAKSLSERAVKAGKAGIFNISDLGSFFIAQRIPALVEYEDSIPKHTDFEIKAICAYHRGDFARFSTQQQERIFAAHRDIVHNSSN